MKKLFTLIAMAFMAVCATAQTTLIDYPNSKAGTSISGTTTEGTVKIHMNKDAVDCYSLKNGYSSENVMNGNHIKLTTDGGFKAGDVVTVAGAINNSDETKKGTAVIFSADEAETTATVVHEFEDFINSRLVEEDPAAQSYTLEADYPALYLGRKGNTGTNLTLIKVVRGGGSNPDTPTGETESYKAIVVDGDVISLAPEFAAVVDENFVANNVGTTGRSMVEFGTTNMQVLAVGSAVPEEVEPGEVIDADNHLFEAAAITMGDITWKNGNNKLDINDAENTKLYFVMGQGNAYEKIFAEEIYTDGEATGNFRPYYTYTDYLNGAAGLPSYGLYYKFTPAASGTLKVLVWVNKGNRSTVVVKGSTGLPLTYGKDYKAEGYVNGQRANYTEQAIDPETGEPKVDNQGNPVYEQYQIFFNAEQIDSIHNMYIYESYYNMVKKNEETPGSYTEEELAEKKAQCDKDAVDRRFVISRGNQAFWGWITLPVEAGESYYVFQLSSQLGFGGYDFTVTGASGIKEIAGSTIAPVSNKIYNLRGQEVDASYRGIVVKNGKKFFQR